MINKVGGGRPRYFREASIKQPKGAAAGAQVGPGSVRQIAKQAGVSTATVSRALNNPEAVAPPTRQRVLDITARLGYRPNSLGKNLVTGRSHLVGLVVPDIGTTLYGEMAKGIEDVLAGTGLQVVLASTRDRADLEREAVGSLLRHSVDTGIVINARLEPGGAGHGDAGHSDAGHSGWVHISPESLGYGLRVELDNYAGGRLAVRHLLATGRRDVAHLAGPLREGSERERGWRDELASAGLEPGRRELGGYTFESGFEFGRALLRGGLPDAVFAAGDLMAAGVLAALTEAGISVPDAVALVGFDDAAYSRLLYPPLTTIRQPAYGMGRKAAEIALLRLAGETPGSAIFGPELVVRGSAPGRPD